MLTTQRRCDISRCDASPAYPVRPTTNQRRFQLHFHLHLATANSELRTPSALPWRAFVFCGNMGVGELNVSVHYLMLVFPLMLALMFMLKFARVSARIGSQS
ncbi:MAG: hypothetical protein ACKOBV_10175 [Candidatus Kapaibacterium sp.]